jgi:hypothetical protein
VFQPRWYSRGFHVMSWGYATTTLKVARGFNNQNASQPGAGVIPEEKRCTMYYRLRPKSGTTGKWWKMYLSVVTLTGQNCRLHFCLLIDYGHMARPTSV